MRAGRLIVKVAQGLLIFIKARAMATYGAMYYARESCVCMESGGKISIGSFSRRAPRALKTEFGIRNLETQDLLVSPLFGGVPGKI